MTREEFAALEVGDEIRLYSGASIDEIVEEIKCGYLLDDGYRAIDPVFWTLVGKGTGKRFNQQKEKIMTNEEAIEILEIPDDGGTYTKPYRLAVDVAISALRAQELPEGYEIAEPHEHFDAVMTPGGLMTTGFRRGKSDSCIFFGSSTYITWDQLERFGIKCLRRKLVEPISFEARITEYGTLSSEPPDESRGKRFLLTEIVSEEGK